jgi:hypothetical protein
LKVYVTSGNPALLLPFLKFAVAKVGSYLCMYVHGEVEKFEDSKQARKYSVFDLDEHPNFFPFGARCHKTKIYRIKTPCSS